MNGFNVATKWKIANNGIGKPIRFDVQVGTGLVGSLSLTGSTTETVQSACTWAFSIAIGCKFCLNHLEYVYRCYVFVCEIHINKGCDWI